MNKIIKISIQKIILGFPFYLWLLSLSVICSALILEIFFGLQPCKLCLYQRFPYYVIIILGAIYFPFRNISSIYKTYIFVSCLLLFGNAILAFYHAAIEYGIFTNIFHCSSVDINITDIDKLRNSLQGSQAIPCDKASFTFILSLSGWNFLLSFLLGILSLMHILKTFIANNQN